MWHVHLYLSMEGILVKCNREQNNICFVKKTMWITSISSFFFLTEHMVDTPVRDIYKLKTIILACVAKQKETYGAGSVPVDRVQQLAQSVQENFCIYNSTDD